MNTPIKPKSDKVLIWVICIFVGIPALLLICGVIFSGFLGDKVYDSGFQRGEYDSLTALKQGKYLMTAEVLPSWGDHYAAEKYTSNEERARWSRGYVSGYASGHDPYHRGYAYGWRSCKFGDLKISGEILDAVARRQVGPQNSYVFESGYTQGWAAAYQ